MKIGHRMVQAGLAAGVFLAVGTGCIPKAPGPIKGIVTKVERTTVTVRDPEGKVIRIEEKETILQDYLASEPVRMKTVGAPPPKPGE